MAAPAPPAQLFHPLASPLRNCAPLRARPPVAIHRSIQSRPLPCVLVSFPETVGPVCQLCTSRHRAVPAAHASCVRLRTTPALVSITAGSVAWERNASARRHRLRRPVVHCPPVVANAPDAGAPCSRSRRIPEPSIPRKAARHFGSLLANDGG